MKNNRLNIDKFALCIKKKLLITIQNFVSLNLTNLVNVDIISFVSHFMNLNILM